MISIKMDILNKNWKGKDKPRIIVSEENIYYIEHRKDKNTGEVIKNRHKVSINNIISLIEIIIDIDKGELIAPREIWEEIIQRKNLDVDINAFNGGTNRAKYYFPLYYYPLKVLEYLGGVNYNRKIKRNQAITYWYMKLYRRDDD